VEPLLYVSNLAPNVTEADLARTLEHCAPMRPTIHRDGISPTLTGTIEFKTIDKAEKALATLQNRPLLPPAPPCVLMLSAFPPTSPPMPIPQPMAIPRLVKHLPENITDSELYDLFRPFGVLAAVHNQIGLGRGIGLVEYWHEDDAKRAQEAMHCAEVGEQNISVQIYQPRRASGGVPSGDFNMAAPVFIPSGVMANMASNPYGAIGHGMPPHSPSHHAHSLSSGSIGPMANYSPPRPPMHYGPAARSPSHPFVHGPGQQVQYAPISGPGSGSQSGLIDPCNLFCKNLDPSIDSNELFTHFRPFGQIVSARVMRTETGQSRGFGFVSFQTPDQAQNALRQMNGVVLGSKAIIVRLHEPKQLRQEKLAQRFASGGGSGHPRAGGSGATSPTPSDGGESFSAWLPDKPGRRSSGSYYNAALAGNLNVPLKYDDLSALSPVVRKEVLTGELSRRLKQNDTVTESETDALVEAMSELDLKELCDGFVSPTKFVKNIQVARDTLNVPARYPESSSPAPDQDSSSSGKLLAPNSVSALPTPASAPEHPSTPVSISSSRVSPPRTSSPSGSVNGGSERDRLLAAVSRTEREPARAAEITELLLTLSRKERAMCIFNPEYLKSKIVDAKDVLDATDENAPPETLPAVDEPVGRVAPSTPQVKRINSTESSPRTPDLASRATSAVASPAPATPGTSNGSSTHTLASLARLPATEIVKLASSPSSTTGLPLPKADAVVTKATDEFIDGLMSKPVQQQKQLLGEKLFKVVRAFGVKGAPKITIGLLDSEDLRALAHLMNSYPEVLKEKVIQNAPTK
jgi:polyadenylate-binding protein